MAGAHGGTYSGPGDTVPGGGGGGGGGGGPSTPGPAGPSTPGPAGPSTPGPAGPGTPGAGPGAGPSKPSTGGGGSSGPDLTVWTFWWEFNKAPYINLKAHIHSGGTKTGSDDFFLGFGEQEQAKDSMRPTEAQIRQKVVPALLRALEKETNNDIVTGALIALAKIGDEKTEAAESEFEKTISKFLGDSNQEISETAAVALGILANDASVETLKELVYDTARGRKLVQDTNEVNYRTRAFAAYGLGLIGARTADDAVRQECAKYLLDVLHTDDSSTRDIKVACLVSLSLVPVQQMEAPELAEGEVAAPHQSRTGMVDAVLAFLDNEEENYLVRAHAPVTLARLIEGMPEDLYDTYKQRVCEDLLERIGKHSKAENEILQSCAIGLGLLGDNDNEKVDAEIRKALMAIDHADIQTDYFAHIGLAHVAATPGNTEASPGECLKDVNKWFEKKLGGRKPDARAWAALGIGVLGAAQGDNGETPNADLIRALRLKLADAKNPGEVGAYAVSCGILNDLEAEKLLVEKLQTIKDEEARGYVCIGLGLMGASAAVEDIEKIIEESKYRPDLLRAAAISLGLLGDKQLVDKLIEMLRTSSSLATQASLSSALGFIGDSRSIDPLVEMLEDKSITERARGFAAAALGIVADKEQLPWNSKISVDLNYRAATVTLNANEAGTGIVNIL